MQKTKSLREIEMQTQIKEHPELYKLLRTGTTALAFIATLTMSQAAAQPQTSLDPTFNITASADQGTFSIRSADGKTAYPVVETKVGQETVLVFTDSSGVHGVESAALGIPRTTIIPGNPQRVTFTPTKAGTYVISCDIPCGPKHANMKFTVKVDQ